MIMVKLYLKQQLRSSKCSWQLPLKAQFLPTNKRNRPTIRFLSCLHRAFQSFSRTPPNKEQKLTNRRNENSPIVVLISRQFARKTMKHRTYAFKLNLLIIVIAKHNLLKSKIKQITHYLPVENLVNICV